MKVKVKKLWLGHASIRDYVVKKAIKDGEDLTIEFQGKQKSFPYRSLKGHLLNTNKERHKSKYPPYLEYGLIDFPW